MNLLSLFSNIGVSEAYLKEHGFNVKVANEIEDKRAEIYENIYPETYMIRGNISEKKIKDKLIQKSLEEDVNVIIATPPCQGISRAGKKVRLDKRNFLIKDIIDIFNSVMPDYMLIENVDMYMDALIQDKGNDILTIREFINKSIDKSVYAIDAQVFNAKYFDTPQSRKRMIIRIWKIDKLWSLPEEKPVITLEKAIGDLPSLESGQKSHLTFHYAKKHHPNHIYWLSYTPTGKTAFDNEDPYRPVKEGRLIKGYHSNYKRMRWDKPAQTITMSSGGLSCQCNCHPGRMKQQGIYSDARALTPLELFRVMGLPDNWPLPITLSDNKIRKYIGEGLPPKMLLAFLKKIIG